VFLVIITTVATLLGYNSYELMGWDKNNGEGGEVMMSDG